MAAEADGRSSMKAPSYARPYTLEERLSLHVRIARAPNRTAREARIRDAT